MAETKIADTYAKLDGKEEGRSVHCKCGSRQFKVAVEHEQRNTRLWITCGRCGVLFLGLWAANWQIEQYTWDKHARDVEETTCIQCGMRLFAIKTQDDSNILLVRVSCNKCGHLIMKFGAAQYQLM